jgi:hypothetical protein
MTRLWQGMKAGERLFLAFWKRQMEMDRNVFGTALCCALEKGAFVSLPQSVSAFFSSTRLGIR